QTQTSLKFPICGIGPEILINSHNTHLSNHGPRRASAQGKATVDSWTLSSIDLQNGKIAEKGFLLDWISLQ
ncbi:MAG: hypothetical protein RIF36_24935, partial [Imperialibacter sp.]|uniref:hypothetical protein n=1 Tax=Imperialibacter sp. TaxID=2038411 RepID=UPI0032EB293B